ncbi:DNA-binding protein H-NS [Paraburkholderia kururiensis]
MKFLSRLLRRWRCRNEFGCALIYPDCLQRRVNHIQFLSEIERPLFSVAPYGHAVVQRNKIPRLVQSINEGKAAVSAPAGKKAAKAGSYVRGHQAPKYHDPKSGATWSGRGRAPAWIAGAKDRTKFLIA